MYPTRRRCCGASTPSCARRDTCAWPIDREDGSFHGPEAHVHHGFDRAELVEAMRQAGFSEVRVSTATEIVKPAHDGHLATYPVFLAIGAKR